MGAVFRARHLKLGREVAIKRLNPEYSACTLLVERFENEAKAVIQIEDPHICDVNDVGFDPQIGHYIVMEWLAGGSLRGLLRMLGRVPYQSAVQLIRHLLLGLDATHRAGIVHRDIKPENAFVVTRQPWTASLDLSAVDVKLLDFGIARMAGTPGFMTMMGPMTVMYAAPEQAIQPTAVTSTADLWAVGVVLYELIVGKLPFADTDPGSAPWQAVASRGGLVSSRPSPMHKFVPEVPPRLSEVVDRCLLVDASRRYLSAQELSAALAPFETVDPIAPTELGGALQMVAARSSLRAFGSYAGGIILVVGASLALVWVLDPSRVADPEVVDVPQPTQRVDPPVAGPPGPAPELAKPPVIEAPPVVEASVAPVTPTSAPRPDKQAPKPRPRPVKDPPAKAGPPLFDVAVAKSKLEQFMRDHAPACWAANPDAPNLQVTVQVSPVGEVTIKQAANSAIRECLFERASKLTLGPSVDGGEFNYRFVRPGG
jgi:hypothetical protein